MWQVGKQCGRIGNHKKDLHALVPLDVPLEDGGLVVLVEADAALLHDARRGRRPRDRRRLLLHRAHVDELWMLSRRQPDRPHNSSLWGLSSG